MNFIVENWYIILALAVALGVAAVYVYRYFNLPSEAQLAKVREWLLWAVTGAEKELGGGTGRLKLRQVYDALEDMREMLENNPAAAALVNGGEAGGHE